MALALNTRIAALGLILFNILCLTLAQNLDYHDIEVLGMSCSPSDSCNGNLQLPFGNRSCECDNACNRFGDCCIDAPNNRRRVGNNITRTTENFECLEHESDFGAYVVSTCPSDYQGSADLLSKCQNLEDTSDPNDPLAATPTTDIVLNVTYKNHYCAQCHNANPQNLRMWNINITCDRRPDNSSDFSANSTYVEDHLIFLNNSETEDHLWGFYYPEDEENAERQFYPCYFTSSVPETLSPHVRLCRANLISTCAMFWRRQVVRRNCDAYMAVVYISGKLYRNPHCALCNFERLTRGDEDTLCTIPGTGILKRDKKSALSFGVLMDVNMRDGNLVGEVQDNRCPNGQMWDRFIKKCRSTACALPGYRVQNGQCVPP